MRQAWQKGCRDGGKPIPIPSVIPAKAGIQERRPGGEGIAGFIGWHAWLSCLWLSFLLRGNSLSQPLDSSFRWNDGEGCGQECGRHGKRAVGMAANPFLPPSSSQRRLESRKGGRRVKGWQGLSDGTLGCRACGCHSRYAGMTCFNHWIPAFAGMTERAAVKNAAGMVKGLSGWRETHSYPRRHSSEGWNQ